MEYRSEGGSKPPFLFGRRDMGHIEFMEQGVCAKCGSGNVNLWRMERDASVLLWFTCDDCGCRYIEAYDYSCKGVLSGDEVQSSEEEGA